MNRILDGQALGVFKSLWPHRGFWPVRIVWEFLEALEGHFLKRRRNSFRSYKNCGHRLIKVRVGGLVSHDPHSISTIPWKGTTIYPRDEQPTDVKTKVEKYSRELKSSLRVKWLSSLKVTRIFPSNSSQYTNWSNFFVFFIGKMPFRYLVQMKNMYAKYRKQSLWSVLYSFYVLLIN